MHLSARQILAGLYPATLNSITSARLFNNYRKMSSISTSSTPSSSLSSSPSLPSINNIYVSCRNAQEKQVLTHTLGSALSGSDGKIVFFDRNAQPNYVLDQFNLQTYLTELKTRELGQVLMYSPYATSTQALLKGALSEAPPNSCLIATTQNGGKGRGGNSWSSPVGCLLYSYKFTSTQPEKILYLQYLACLVLVEAIKHVSKTPHFDIRIKWPNDIYTGPSFGTPVKLGGILSQTSFTSQVFDVCIGIGINVDNKEPTTCLNELLNQVNPNAPKISREALLASYLTIFEQYLTILNNQGFQPFEADYLKTWLHTDQVVSVLGKPSSHGVESKSQELKIAGLTSSGYLLAKSLTAPYVSYELQPDGNSFDFLKGLIVNKVIR